MTVVITEHILDEAAGVYSLTFAEQITRQWEEVTHVPVDPEDPESEMETIVTPHEETTLGHAETIVFSADDERWKSADGSRRPMEEVAAEQRDIVRDALNQRAVEAEKAAADEANVQEMPGSGEAL